MKGVKKFCDCCCYLCINWLFNILNNGAYTFIHLSGDAYCTSALEVLAIRIKDLVITGVVTILSVVITFVIVDFSNSHSCRYNGFNLSGSICYN